MNLPATGRAVSDPVVRGFSQNFLDMGVLTPLDLLNNKVRVYFCQKVEHLFQRCARSIDLRGDQGGFSKNFSRGD